MIVRDTTLCVFGMDVGTQGVDLPTSSLQVLPSLKTGWVI